MLEIVPLGFPGGLVTIYRVKRTFEVDTAPAIRYAGVYKILEK